MVQNLWLLTHALIIDLHLTLRYLGVPIHNKSFMFAILSLLWIASPNLIKTSQETKNMIIFHRVREAVAAKLIGYVHGESNPADILCEYWGYS